MCGFQLQSDIYKAFEALKTVLVGNPMVITTVAVAVAVSQALAR